MPEENLIRDIGDVTALYICRHWLRGVADAALEARIALAVSSAVRCYAERVCGGPARTLPPNPEPAV